MIIVWSGVMMLVEEESEEDKQSENKSPLQAVNFIMG